jgi:hypothetical protein
LKHLESNVNGLKETLDGKYKMAVRLARLDMFWSLEDFRVTLDRVAKVGQ